MARIGSTLLVLGLLGGTAAAFAVTERLKVQPSPITRVRIDKAFSPVCRCPLRVARVDFGLRKADRLALAIVDADGEVVRRLAASRSVAAGSHVFEWDGRDDAGNVVADATYRPQIRLERARRTITFPNPIAVDTTPPRVTIVAVGRTTISPNGDLSRDSLTVSYRLDERARTTLLANGAVGQVRKSRKLEGMFRWYGRAGGERLPAGTYEVSVTAEDLVGNRSRPVRAASVRIEYPPPRS